jgi:hypothetical protein
MFAPTGISGAGGPDAVAADSAAGGVGLAGAADTEVAGGREDEGGTTAAAAAAVAAEPGPAALIGKETDGTVV